MSESVLLPAGSLLISRPEMLDPNFMHTVVLLCAHHPEGAHGLVVNQTSGLYLDQLVPDHEHLAGLHLPVLDGGPVGRDQLQFVHDVPLFVPGGREVAAGLFLGGEVDALGDFLRAEPGAQGHVRLFLGYSGWGEGQLDGELREGSWLVGDPAPDLVLDARQGALQGDHRERTWREAIRRLEREHRGLGHLPPDVDWN